MRTGAPLLFARPRPVPTEPDAADHDAPADDRPAEPSPPARAEDRKPLRWGRLAVVGVALLAAAVWFAPALAARSGLRHTVLHRLFPELNADVTVGRAELNWAEPVVLRNVTVTAPGADTPALTAAAVRTKKPLHALLAAAFLGDGGPADYGTIALAGPHLRGALRPGGSDLEDLLAPLLAGGSSDPAPGFGVTIEGGAVTLTDPAGGTSAGRELAGAVRVPAGSGLPDRAELAGRWGDGERSGPVELRLTGAAGEAGRWAARADGVPLAAAAPLLTRFAEPGRFSTGRSGGFQPPSDGAAGGGEGRSLRSRSAAGSRRYGPPRAADGDGPAAAWELAGLLSADLTGTLADDAVTAAGRVSGDRVAVRSAAWPAGDRALLGAAELTGGAAFGAAGLKADGLAFTSNLFDLEANGPVPLALPSDPADLLNADRALAGRVDAAKLADQLPGLLGLADGVTIEAGTLTFSADATAADGDARRLTAAADLSGLRASVPSGGTTETVTPREPVAARLSAIREPDGVRVERVTVTADGISVDGGGAADDFAADLAVDLAAWDRTFGRLADLGGALSGTATGTVQVRRAGPDRFAARVVADGKDLAFAPTARPAVTEPIATVKLAADLLRDGAGRWAPRFGGASVGAAGDRLTAVPADGGGWAVTFDGELARLKDRVAAYTGLPDVSLTGDTRASGTVRRESGGWAVADGRAEFRRLAVDAPGVRVREAAATLTGAGSFDPAAGTAAGRFAWVGDAATVRADRFTFDPAAVPAARAEVTAEGESGRVWRWFDALAGSGVRPAGRFAADGTLTAGGPGGATEEFGAAGRVRASDLSFLTPPDPRAGPGAAWRTVWHEPAASAAGTVRYVAGDDVLKLGPLAVAATGAGLSVGGEVDDPFGVAHANLTGTLSGDWAALAPRLGLTGDARIAGRFERPVRVLGPLIGPADSPWPPPGLRARAGLGWDELAASGLSFGPGDVTATLDRGRVRVDGVDWPVTVAGGGPAGRLRTTPLLDFTGSEPALRLPGGPLLTGVRLTPEVARDWLGLASPLAAGAASAEGSFGVDLDGAAVPLADLSAGDFRRAGAGGRLEIESADLTPGPAAARLISAVRGANRLFRGSAGGDLEDVRVTLPRQSVPFRVGGGRVSHRRLTARGGSVEVTTSGSVGLDGSLDLVAEVPLGGDLGGRRASLPVRGTVGDPRIDPSALARAAAEGAVGGAIGDVLGKSVGDADELERRLGREVGRGLDRLFGRE